MAVFDTNNQEWTKLEPKGVELPPLETFGSVLVDKDKDHPKIMMVCGYDGKLC